MAKHHLPSTVFLLSFAAAFMPFQAHEAEAFLVSFFLLGGLMVEVFLNPARQPKRSNEILVMGFAFWALAFASVLLSAAPYVSFIYFCFFSALPLTFLLTIFV